MDVARQEPYRYKKLLDQHIRILKVTGNGETFEAELQQFHIEHLPFFLALSWTWPKAEYGDSLATQSFKCDGFLFTIPATLYNALMCLLPQQCPSSLRIWIDAISINQHDAPEKNVQVPMMSLIYGRANRVIVWLGDASQDSDNIMDEIFMESTVDGLEPMQAIITRNELPVIGLPDSSDNVWLAIGNLLTRSWFSRLWIVQEVVLGQEIDVLCGRSSVAWEQLVLFSSSIREAGLQTLCYGANLVDETRTNGFAGLRFIEDLRSQKPLRGPSILSVVSSSRVRYVEKPLDKVYGFLGVVDENLQKAITVDYSEKSQREYWTAYLQLGRYLVKCDLHHEILGKASSIERPARLPTWCPNLNSPYPEVYGIVDVTGVRAGWSDSSPLQYNVSFVANSDSIQIPGFEIDSIDAFVPLKNVREGRQEPILGPDGTAAQWLEREEICIELAYNACHDSDRALKAHVRTLVTNTWESRTPISHDVWPTVKQAYDYWLELCNSWKLHSTYEGPASNPGHRRRAIGFCRGIDRCRARPYFVTRHKRLGRGAMNMKVGDQICILYSARSPFILRYEDGSNVAKLIGDAYLDGCMNLETMPDEGRGPDRIFTIG